MFKMFKCGVQIQKAEEWWTEIDFSNSKTD
jgi:hypothetical protein